MIEPQDTQTTDHDDRQPAPAGGLVDHINDTLDHQPEAPAAVNDPLTGEQEADEDGEVTLPGSYADCRWDSLEFTVRVTNRERVLWDKTSRKHGWGSAEDSPNFALTFMAWSACKRDELPAGSLTLDQFIDQVQDIEGRRVARVRPTR